MKILIYGESHFHADEVEAIRESIINSKPNIILLENIEDKEFYEKTTKATIDELEPEYKDVGHTLLKQFLVRERAMISTIKKTIKSNPTNSIICIQVGDTHLRTIYTKELGLPTLDLYIQSIEKTNKNTQVEVFRSKYSEIK